MAYDKIVDSTALDTALTYTADRIRVKTGDTAQIAWDNDKGFGDAVDAISGDYSVEDGLITRTISGEYVNDRISAIADRVFTNTKLTSISCQNVTTIGVRAFEGSRLQTFNFPSVTSIKDYALCNTPLSSIMPSQFPNLQSVGNSCFELSKISNIEFPEGFTTLSYRAFYTCTSLAKVVLPTTVTTIGTQAFNFKGYGPTNPTVAVVIKSETPPTAQGDLGIGENTTIYVPDESVNAYKAATNWASCADRIRGLSELEAST